MKVLVIVIYYFFQLFACFKLWTTLNMVKSPNTGLHHSQALKFKGLTRETSVTPIEPTMFANQHSFYSFSFSFP